MTLKVVLICNVCRVGEAWDDDPIDGKGIDRYDWLTSTEVQDMGFEEV